MSRPLVSLAAGALAPLPLLVILQVVAAPSPILGPVPWKIDFAAALLAVLAIALWPPIRPSSFAIAFAIASPCWCALLLGAARSSNLFGLGLIFVAGSGALIASTVAVLATLLRRFRLPSWIPAATLMAAVVVLVAAGAVQSTVASDHDAQLMGLFAQLDAAERSYAAGPPFRGFTCNGPDLPSIHGIEWRTDYNLGGNDRNQGPYAGYWVSLHCQAAARPSYFTVTAVPTSGAGRILTYDSRTGRISGAPLRR